LEKQEIIWKELYQQEGAYHVGLHMNISAALLILYFHDLRALANMV
jgi:hypothetical protein